MGAPESRAACPTNTPSPGGCLSQRPREACLCAGTMWAAQTQAQGPSVLLTEAPVCSAQDPRRNAAQRNILSTSFNVAHLDFVIWAFIFIL